MSKKTPEEEQREKIEKYIKKFGGSPADVWAAGQAQSGFMRFDGNVLHIQHSGVLGRLSVGKGAKRIPIHSITAMQLKPAGAVVSGFMQVTMGGAVEAKSQFGRQSFDAASDENSMMFTKREQPFFERLRDAIEQAVADQRRPSSAPAPAAPDIVAQIKGLADLHSAGVLSDDEFSTKKADLLGRL